MGASGREDIEARSHLRIAAGVALCVGAYGWAVFALSFSHDGLIAPRFNAPGVDFMVFWTAARAALAGDLALVFDGARFTAALNADFAGWLSGPLPFHPWIYPPSYLLLALPFGVAPFGWAYAAAMALSFCALAAALLWGERGWRRLLFAGAVVLAPATSLNIIVGQNAFLTGALLVGGIRRLPGRPVLAGALLGALTVKPQLALMAPVALVAARQGRAVLAFCASALAIAAMSAAVFGPGVWRQWFELVADPQNPTRRAWSALSLMWGDSVYSCAALLGAGPIGAAAAQGAAIAAAAASVAWMFARPAPLELRLAVLLAATIFAAPHVAGYDMLLLAVAAALFLCDAARRGFGPFDLTLALLLFLAPLYGPPRLGPIGYAAPTAIVLFVARCGCRAGAAGTSASRHIS